MDKIWINNEDREDRIIAIGNKTIYKLNPKSYNISQNVTDLENDNIPKEALSIPFSYIRKIQYKEGTKYIRILFGKESQENFRINDIQKRFEIFKYFKENIPKTKYEFEKYHPFKAAKKPIIAVSITLLLFLWTLYLAGEIEKGYEYEIVGGSGASITGIVLGLANLGIVNIILIFGSLLTIGIIAIIRKMNKRPSVHNLIFVR